MGLLQQEIKELRDLQKKVLAGEVPLERAAAQIAISNQIAKREQLIVNLLSLSAKHGSRAIKGAVSLNLIGDGTAIEVGEVEERVICKAQGGKCVSREDCLDFSGIERNQEECQSCQHFTTTRKQLLGTLV